MHHLLLSRWLVNVSDFSVCCPGHQQELNSLKLQLALEKKKGGGTAAEALVRFLGAGCCCMAVNLPSANRRQRSSNTQT